MDQDDHKSQDQSVLLNQKAKVITKLPAQKKNHNKKIFKNYLFFILWIYLIIKLFVTDIDILLARSFGLQNISVYLILRFITLSIILLLIWKTLGNKRFFKNLGLFFLFPIYPGFWIFSKFSFWTIPSFLIKMKFNFILYSYVELVLNFIAEFKKSMLKIFVFVAAFFIIYNLDSYWMIVSMILLFMLLFSHVYRRYKQVFTPIKIFRMDLSSGFKTINPFSIEKIEKQTQFQNDNKKFTEDEKVFNQTEQILMMCELSDAIGVEIKNILNNSTYLKSVIWRLLYSFFALNILLAGINFALFKYDASNFSIAYTPDFFNFCQYSFYMIFPGQSDILPMTNIAKFIQMLGGFSAYSLGILIVTFYFVTYTSKYKRNLDNLIEYFEIYSKDAKEYINNKHKSNPTDFIKNIKNQSSKIKDLVKALDFIFGKKK